MTVNNNRHDNGKKSLFEAEAQAFSKQKYQFWMIQFCGWLGYAFVVFIAIIRPQFSTPGFNLSGQIINLVVETLSGFVLTYLQWLFIRKVVQLPVKKTLLLSFTFAALLGVMHNVIKLSSFKVIIFQQHWNEAWNMLEFGGWLMFSLATMFAWTSIFFIMLYNTKLQKEHERLLMAQTLAKDAQLKMLRYQLNPHFMFNTLNAISTLILLKDNDKANDMLYKLCDFFRYSLEVDSKSTTTLKKEVDLLDVYLSIEKVRFGSKLTVKMEVSPLVLSCRVPTMLLQPLVENAIKYAIEPKKGKGLIIIQAKTRDGRLLISVIDDGNVIPDKVDKGFGIGISNTKARLDAIFNGDYDVNMMTNKKYGTEVVISIPFES